MPGGRSVRRLRLCRRGVRELGLGRSGGRESFRQAAAVGGGDFLNAPGQALPQMKTVADLDRLWGAIGDALSIGKRAVAADDLHTRMSAQPSAELFGVSAFPERQRESGFGVDQESAVGIAVQREVVHAEHPGCDQRRQRHPHQLREHGAPRQPDVEDTQHPRPTSAGQHHADRLDQLLQQRSAPLIAHGQSRHLLGEGHLRAGRVLAVQTAHAQVDADRPASQRGIGEAPYVAAVYPLAQRAAPRTPCWSTGSRTSLHRNGRTRNIDRDHQHSRQLR